MILDREPKCCVAMREDEEGRVFWRKFVSLESLRNAPDPRPVLVPVESRADADGEIEAIWEEYVKSHLFDLTIRERIVVARRWGVLGNRACTQQQVAEELRLSRRTIGRAERSAREKLEALSHPAPGSHLKELLNNI